MSVTYIAAAENSPVPIHIVSKDNVSEVLDQLGEAAHAWVQINDFTAKAGAFCKIPDLNGALAAVLFGEPAANTDRFALLFGKLGTALPSGEFQVTAWPESFKTVDIETALFAISAGAYRFSKYKAPPKADIRIVIEDIEQRQRVERMAAAVSLTRDLINTPTNDLGTEELAEQVCELANNNGGTCSVIVGDDLLTENFPLVHMVGRAAENLPRLIDITWGDESAPKITLVGKGVVFDTGGLNIKTGSFMTLMKKDMGGAANVIGLAKLIMEAKLNVRLRVIIPTVENAIDGSAFRPGDVVKARNGKYVEIENTDAEGRLVLADALAFADEETPDMIIDMATLTGAARVALGPDLPPVYCDDDAFCNELSIHGANVADPVWRMPLWKPYLTMLDSNTGDINHAPAGGFAGSITAALFLSTFVERAKIWAHFDIYGWTPSPKPARPKGGEAAAIRAIFALLESRFPA